MLHIFLVGMQYKMYILMNVPNNIKYWMHFTFFILQKHIRNQIAYCTLAEQNNVTDAFMKRKDIVILFTNGTSTCLKKIPLQLHIVFPFLYLNLFQKMNDKVPIVIVTV